ncbi:hypothetical protein B9479_001183 [Cryptococcus floricola]|uniref:HSF-type DNA-binding domain-containing protein n=1 Tax=Cryptococcus floricola TaxID=2591691 RepID=A0A5D3B313_9TREE|nr:hypothetical protein B9479_001183 [Cryptococcus floricola]
MNNPYNPRGYDLPAHRQPAYPPDPPHSPFGYPVLSQTQSFSSHYSPVHADQHPPYRRQTLPQSSPDTYSSAPPAAAGDGWNWDQPRAVPVPESYSSYPLGPPIVHQRRPLPHHHASASYNHPPGPSGDMGADLDHDPYQYNDMLPPHHQTQPQGYTKSSEEEEPPQQHDKAAAGKKKKGSKKAEGKQPTFLTKLYSLLGDEATSHIIRWDESGENIIIENPEELADKILPVVYRQSRFASFSRQLNIYGFNRKLSLRNVERGICDPDASTWSHTSLTRDSSPQEILQFKRRVPPRPSQSAKRSLLAQIGPTPAASGTGYHGSLPILPGSNYTSSYANMENYPAFPGSGDDGASPTSSESMSGGGEAKEWRSPPDAYQINLLPDVAEEPPSAIYPGKEYLGFATQAGYGGIPRAYDGWKSGHAQGLGEDVVGSGVNFDYGTPERDSFYQGIPQHLSDSPKRVGIDIPRVHPSLPLPRQPLQAHYPSHSLSTAPADKSPTSLVPQSAPANSGGFSIPIKVQQQHVRTRSVQGEPPSAMLFSPMADGGWGDVPEPAQQQMQGQMNPPPSAPTAGQFDPLDPAAWVRRGMVDISAAAGSGTPVPFDSGTSSRMGSSPASLPNNIGGFAPRSIGHQHFASGGSTPGMGMLGGQSLGALSENSPSTVSPGAWKSMTGGAFSLPSASPLQSQLNLPPVTSNITGPTNESPRAPSAITPAQQARQERRASISSSPYILQSPRQRPVLLPGAGSWTGASLSPLRTISSERGRRGSGVAVPDSVESMSQGSVSGDEASSSGSSR